MAVVGLGGSHCIGWRTQCLLLAAVTVGCITEMAKPYIKIVPVGPRTYLQLTQVFAGIEAAVDGTLDGMKKDLEKTVETWDDKPRFDIDGPRQLGGKIEGNVGTNHKVFAMVNNGVPPHPISASSGGTMRFRIHDYRAKTVPRRIISRAGGSAGVGAWRRRKTVSHPGIVAREFTSVVADKWQTKFIRDFGAQFGLWARFGRAIKGVVRF